MYYNIKNEGHTAPQTNAVINSINQAKTSPEQDPVARAKDLLQLYHAIPNGINYELTNELAMECVEDILEHWLPDGEYRGQEYVALNPTRNDTELGSFTIHTGKGLWSDFSTEDRGGDLISLISYLESCERQSDGAVKILEFIAGMKLDDGATVVKRSRAARPVTTTEYTAILPVPDNANVPTASFGSELGNPTATWTYRDASGRTLFYVHRFDSKKGGKQFRPQTYCKDSSGFQDWRLKAPPTPRPAYGLDKLAERPEAPVLFTEGEKAADAAQRLFPGFVTATTMNGAQSPEKTDFTPFAGRKVYIAPDNDEAGTAYKDRLIQLLRAAGAEVVGVLKLEMLVRGEAALEPGYDLADAETDGWTAEELAEIGDGLWDAVPAERATSPKVLKKAVRKQTAPGKSEAEKAADADVELAMPPLIRTFVEKAFPDGLMYVNGEFYGYRAGYWPRLDQQADVRHALALHFGVGAEPKLINDTLSLLRDFFAKRENDATPKRTLLCLRNGTFNTDTFVLQPHCASQMLRSKIDVDWSESAECPRWEQFIDEIFANDIDKDEKKAFLQEFFGYCLVPDASHHLWVLMVGAGSNGKSVFLGILSALLGRENVSQAHIERLGDKHVRAELENKLVNIASEMSADATVSDGYLKQIVSGDEIEAERKFKDPFSFRPFVRIIGATNHMPRLLDLSDGFFRRLAIVNFNRQFQGKDKNPNLEKELMSELPGILRWALEGLRRLRERGGFILPKSSQAAAVMYKNDSDPVKMFADECLLISDTKGLKPSELYPGYNRWCRGYGFQPMNNIRFGKRMSELGYEQTRSGGKDYWKVEPLDCCSEIWLMPIREQDYLLKNGDPGHAPSKSQLAQKYSI